MDDSDTDSQAGSNPDVDVSVFGNANIATFDIFGNVSEDPGSTTSLFNELRDTADSFPFEWVDCDVDTSGISINHGQDVAYEQLKREFICMRKYLGS